MNPAHNRVERSSLKQTYKNLLDVWTSGVLGYSVLSDYLPDSVLSQRTGAARG